MNNHHDNKIHLSRQCRSQKESVCGKMYGAVLSSLARCSKENHWTSAEFNKFVITRRAIMKNFLDHKIWNDASFLELQRIDLYETTFNNLEKFNVFHLMNVPPKKLCANFDERRYSNDFLRMENDTA